MVSEKDDSFENYGSLYYKWDTEKKLLLVYKEGFESFLREERGTVILSDLIPYNLGALGEYNPLDNKVMRNATEQAKSGSARDSDMPTPAEHLSEHLSCYGRPDILDCLEGTSGMEHMSGGSFMMEKEFYDRMTDSFTAPLEAKLERPDTDAETKEELEKEIAEIRAEREQFYIDYWS